MGDYAAADPGHRVGLVLKERGDSFRGLVMRVLYYLSLADRSKLGLILSKAVYRKWSEQLSESHPDVIYVAERQAACPLELNDAQAATALMRKVLTQRKAVLGDAHPSTLRAAATLGTSLNSLEDFHACRCLRRGHVASSRSPSAATLGPPAPDIITDNVPADTSAPVE